MKESATPDTFRVNDVRLHPTQGPVVLTSFLLTKGGMGSPSFYWRWSAGLDVFGQMVECGEYVRFDEEWPLVAMEPVSTITIRRVHGKQSEVHLVERTERGHGDILCGLDRSNLGFSIGTGIGTSDANDFVACDRCAEINGGPVTGGLSDMFTAKV